MVSGTTSRRDFEKALLAYAASFLCGCATYRAACPEERKDGDPFEGYELRYLTRVQAIAVAAAAEVMLSDCPLVISAIEVAKRADQFLDGIRSTATDQMRTALTALEDFASALVEGDPTTFSAQSLQERRRMLDHLVRSPISAERDITRVVKMLTVFPYYSHPQVRRAIGFVEAESRPRIAALNLARPVHPEPEGFA